MDDGLNRIVSSCCCRASCPTICSIAPFYSGTTYLIVWVTDSQYCLESMGNKDKKEKCGRVRDVGEEEASCDLSIRPMASREVYPTALTSTTASTASASYRNTPAPPYPRPHQIDINVVFLIGSDVPRWIFIGVMGQRAGATIIRLSAISGGMHVPHEGRARSRSSKPILDRSSL